MRAACGRHTRYLMESRLSLTEKQKEYLRKCDHRWNVKTGATGSGKSFVDILITIPKRIFAYHGEGLIVLMGNTRGTLQRNILEPMSVLWPGNVGNIRSDNTVQMFGHKVYVLGADNKKHVARIQGASFEYVYGDEITTWSEDVFQMLKSRLRCEHSHFDGTCNPDSPQHWFKQFLDSDADIYQQAYKIEDGVLPQNVIEELKKEYAGTVYYDRYILGLWRVAEGLIYPMYDNTVPTGDRKYVKYYISMDYGILNPTAMLLWGYCDGVWYAIDEYYHSGRETHDQHTDEQYYEALEELARDLPIERVIVDPSAASFITLIDQKHRFKVWSADNTVLEGIQHVAQCLQDRTILFNDCCTNTIREFGMYRWDEKAKEDRPLKASDHCMDSCRYMCQTLNIWRKKETRGVPWLT